MHIFSEIPHLTWVKETEKKDRILYTIMNGSHMVEDFFLCVVKFRVKAFANIVQDFDSSVIVRAHKNSGLWTALQTAELSTRV